MEEKEIHLRDYVRVLLKRRYTVLTIFVVIFLTTIIATFSTTPVYLATTKILIDKSEPNNLASMNFYYVPYDPDFIETQYQLIKSTAVTEKVVSILSLDRTYDSYFAHPKGSFLGGINEIFSPAKKGPEKINPPEGVSPKAYAIAKEISNAIIVTPVKNTKMVNVGFQSTNPELAVLVANTIVKAYMQTVLEMKMNFSKYTMQWLEEKADEERGKVEMSEQAVQDYMKKKDIVTLENKVAMLPERLTEIANSVAGAETKRKEKEVLYNQAKKIAQNPDKADTIPAVAADPTVQSIRQQIMKAEQNISDLSKKYGRKHPVMATALEDLKVLKEKKDQEVRRAIESIRNDYELAKANEENLKKMAAEAKAATLNLNEQFIQYGALKRESETNKQLFDAIIKRMKEQGITEDIRTVDVAVVERAEVPKSPAKPRKAVNVFLGLIIGLMGGIGMAFFIEYIDNTVKSPEDLEVKTGSPVIGIVNLLKTKDKRIEEVVMKEPQSVFAESYRVIRTSILLSASDRPPKSILITSIAPGEGKTATSVNLAVTIAQSEHSVLLVDGDLRKPRVHKIFGIDNSKGLSTYLAGASDIDDINLITKVVTPGLNIIPSGPIPPNPAELLGSSRMRSLIPMLKEKFDIIIWDSAPLMTVTDSLILSKALDGTILVTKAGVTTYENVRRGMKSLEDIEAHFLGVIMNALDVKESDYYYNRYYNYSYSYGKKSE